MNYAKVGYPTASAYVADIAESSGNQLHTFEAFVRSSGIADELQRLDFEGFARVYNGPGQVERYGRLMREAYERIKLADGGQPAPAPATAVRIPPLGLDEPSPLAPLGMLVLAGLALLLARSRGAAFTG
jgi:hypothetical protein